MAILALAAGTVAFFPVKSARAANDVWISLSGGNWTDGTKWSNLSPPAGGDDVYITSSFSAIQTINFDSVSNSNYNSITVDALLGGTNVFFLPANVLSISSSEIIALKGTASFVQTGGTNSFAGSQLVIGQNSNSFGTYTLGVGATLAAGSATEIIGAGGSGNFFQTGGANSNAGMILGSLSGATGSYTLGAGATLIASNGFEYVGYSGAGHFIQSGGTNTITAAGGLILGNSAGGSGTYDLSTGAALIETGTEYIANQGVGVFTQTGGLHQLNPMVNGGITTGSALIIATAVGSTGAFNLSGGTLSNQGEFVGESGVGTFNQSGGTHIIDGQLALGGDALHGTGTFLLSGGTLSANREYLPYTGHASFNQSGGTHTFIGAASALLLGSFNATTGNYQLSAGTISGAAEEDIGVSGAALFNQSGGSNTAVTNLAVAVTASSTGTYTLTGGNLAVSGGAFIGGGSSFAGGRGNLSVTGPGQLSIGGLLKIYSSGSVVLTGSSTTFIGGLQISPGGGTLMMNNAPNQVIIGYGSSASPNASVRQFLQNGYNNGAWNGGGVQTNPSVGAIVSSTAGASSNLFSLGYGDGADGAVVNPANRQQLLPAGQEEIKYTFAGDANLDGQVNLTDLIVLANHFGSAGAQWDQGDFSYDGSVNLTDLIILSNNFGDGVGNPVLESVVHAQFQADLAKVEAENPSFGAAIATAVPEPLGLGLVSLLAMITRRKPRAHHPRQITKP